MNKYLVVFIYLVFLILAILISCKPNSDEYRIHLELEKIPKHFQVSLYNRITKEEITKEFIGDTFVEMTFTGSVSELTSFNLYFWELLLEEKNIVLLRKERLLIDNEEVILRGEIDNLDITTNSETQKVLMQWRDDAKEVLVPLHEVKTILYEAYKNGDTENQEFEDNMVLRDDLMFQEEEAVVSFILKHKESPTSLYLLDLFYHRLLLDILQEVYSTLGETIKNSKYNEPIEAYLTTKVLEHGDTWNDFKALTIHGDSLSLSGIDKASGKHVLLVFARNGCVPCESSISELKEIYNQYHEELEIVSYYQGMTIDALKSKVEAHQMEWTCLGTTKRSDHRAVRSYNVDAFPKFILISPERKIIYSFKKGYDEGLLTEKLGNFFRNK